MGDPDGQGVVVAIQPRHLAQGRCSCGWAGRPRVLLSSAKVDALVHATRAGCRPAMPLVQPEHTYSIEAPGILTVECPGGCGASFPVPIVVTDALEAPELHDHIYKHLRTCPSARSWVDTALHKEAPPQPSRRIG